MDLSDYYNSHDMEHLWSTLKSLIHWIAIFFEVEDVFQYLSHLDPSKAMGIPNSVLQFCSHSLCSPIYHLFQQCVTQGYLPHEWRIHKIIPIHKSSDKSSVRNYCPISLLCCISKVLELLVYDCIYDNISSHISTNQFGFLCHWSTVQQLLKFMIYIHEAFNNRLQVDTVYFDIRKAFDSVSHGLLLDKLVDVGISASVWRFLKACLTHVNSVSLLRMNCPLFFLYLPVYLRKAF